MYSFCRLTFEGYLPKESLPEESLTVREGLRISTFIRISNVICCLELLLKIEEASNQVITLLPRTIQFPPGTSGE